MTIAHLPVLIVGAGAGGLTTSAVLARHGISSLKSTLNSASQRQALDVDALFTRFDELSPEPSIQYCPQSRLEPIHLAYTRRLGNEVRYGTEVSSFERTPMTCSWSKSCARNPARASRTSGCDVVASAFRRSTCSVLNSRCSLAAKVLDGSGLPRKPRRSCTFRSSVHRIGLEGEIVDVEGRWADISGLSSDGTLLVRPDDFVGWRAETTGPDPAADLHRALSMILGRS